jgi:hypothetical protein
MCCWSLLKVREGNYKRKHGGSRWNLEVERTCCSSPGALKTSANLWEGRMGDSQPVINEWGGAWVVSRPGKGQSMGNLHTHLQLTQSEIQYQVIYFL